MKPFLLLSMFSFIVLVQNTCAQEIQSETSVLKGKWDTVKTLNTPLARHECSFVAVDDTFYLLGGRGIKSISIYDVNTKTWTEGAKPPVEIHHFQAVAYQGNIYMFGAMTGRYPYEKPLPNILIYNPEKNEWREGSEIPKDRRRGSAGVVIQNTKAYIVSGIVDGHNSTHVPWVDAYDFETDTWTVLADAPRARDHFHAAINDGKIYAVGGRNSSYATNQTFDLTIPDVDVYDINSNSWTTLSENNNLKIERAGASCVFLGNDLIIIGGESMSQKEAHSQVDAYNIKINKWHKLDSLNRGRHGSQAIVYKNTIYIVAGSGNRGGKPELNSMESFQLNEK